MSPIVLAGQAALAIAQSSLPAPVSVAAAGSFALVLVLRSARHARLSAADSIEFQHQYRPM